MGISVKIAVCDDEKNIRELLGSKIREIYPEAELSFYESGNLAGEQASTLAAASKTMKEAAQTEGNGKTEAGTVNDRTEKSREAVNGAGQKKEEVIQENYL